MKNENHLKNKHTYGLYAQFNENDKQFVFTKARFAFQIEKGNEWTRKPVQQKASLHLIKSQTPFLKQDRYASLSENVQNTPQVTNTQTDKQINIHTNTSLTNRRLLYQ